MNIVERAITPFNPASNRVQNRDRYNLFAPAAGTNKIGLAGYNPEHFSVTEQIVSLNTDITGEIDKIQGIDGRLVIAEGKIQTIEGDLYGEDVNLKNKVLTLWTDVRTSGTGLKDRMSTVESLLNDSETGLSVRLDVVETNLSTAEQNITNLETEVDSKIPLSQKNAANGVTPLDGNKKVPLANLPDSIVGQVEYKGTWNAATNTPFLPITPPEKGHYYITSTTGMFNGVYFDIGDWIISDGVNWDKVDNTGAVSSVNGQTGVVVLDLTDFGITKTAEELNNPGLMPNATTTSKGIASFEGSMFTVSSGHVMIDRELLDVLDVRNAILLGEDNSILRDVDGAMILNEETRTLICTE